MTDPIQDADLTEWNKMVSGQLYCVADPYLFALTRHVHEVLRRYNQNEGYDISSVAALFGRVGKNFYIEKGFFCDYGKNISVGDNFYANNGLVVLDTCAVTFGDNCMVGPQVGIYTATHPLDHKLRAAAQEYGKPITVGNDVWIGGHAVINPGVTIGNRVVVASGSVVTKDVPDDVVVGGNPARILKRLDDEA